MNIVKLQDDLKGLSDNQLKQVMMSGAVPQFLVLSEMQRRKMARENAQGDGPAPGESVAEEYLSAGIPQMRTNLQVPEGGIASYAAGGEVAESRWKKGEDDAAYYNPWTGKMERPPSSPDVRKPRKYAEGGPVTAKDLIKQFEGFRDVAYRPTPADPWTIGYGTTKGVTEGMKIDKEQAEALLARDVAQAEAAIDRLVDVPLTPAQRAAVASLIYNIGVGRFARSKARKALNSGDIDGFLAEAFSEDRGFVKADGKPMEGLIKRRQAEKQLFLYGDDLYSPDYGRVEVATSGDDAGIRALLNSDKSDFQIDTADNSGPIEYTPADVPPTVGGNDIPFYERAYPVPEPTDDTPLPKRKPLQIIITGGREEEIEEEKDNKDNKDSYDWRNLPRSEWPDEQFKRRLKGFAEGGEVEEKYMRHPLDPNRPTSFMLPSGNGVRTILLKNEDEPEEEPTASGLAPRMRQRLNREAPDVPLFVGGGADGGVQTRRGVRGASDPIRLNPDWVKSLFGSRTGTGGQMARQNRAQRDDSGEASNPAVDWVKSLFSSDDTTSEQVAQDPTTQTAQTPAGGVQTGGIAAIAPSRSPGMAGAQQLPQAPVPAAQGATPPVAEEPTDPYIEYIRNELENSKSNKLADFLLQTGIGMMASDKPDTLQNLGIGAQQGIKGLMANRRAEAQREQELRELEGAYRRGKVVADARGNAVTDVLNDLMTQRRYAQQNYQTARNELLKANPMAITEARQNELLRRALQDPMSEVYKAAMALNAIDAQLAQLGIYGGVGAPASGFGLQSRPLPEGVTVERVD